MNPWLLTLGLLAFTVVDGLIMFAVYRSKKKRKPRLTADTFRNLMNVPAPAADSPRAAELRQNLRLKFLHQEDKVEDAIQFERDRMPTASLEELMQAAITRWERDNQ